MFKIEDRRSVFLCSAFITKVGFVMKAEQKKILIFYSDKCLPGWLA